MLKRIKSTGLDRVKWDACIAAAGNIPYGLAWYLDAVAPDWEAVIDEQDDQYITVLPVTFIRKAGYRLVAQPLFCQQLGIFSRKPSLPPDYVRNFIGLAFPAGQRVLHYAFQARNIPWLKPHLPIQEIPNALIDCRLSYPELYQKFNANRRRDLRKAEQASLQWQTGNKFQPVLLQLYNENVANKFPFGMRRHLVALAARIMAAAVQHNTAIIAVAVTPNDEPCAGVLFLQFQNRIVYLLPAANKLGRQLGATTFLINHLLIQKAGTACVLDMEGSRTDGVARFYKSLGAIPEYYGLICNLRLPWPIKLYQYLKNVART